MSSYQYKDMVLQCTDREDIKYSSDKNIKQQQKKKTEKKMSMNYPALSWKAFEKDITRVSRPHKQGCSFIFYFNVI